MDWSEKAGEKKEGETHLLLLQLYTQESTARAWIQRTRRSRILTFRLSSYSAHLPWWLLYRGRWLRGGSLEHRAR